MKLRQRKILTPKTVGKISMSEATASFAHDAVKQLEKSRLQIKELENRIIWQTQMTDTQKDKVEHLQHLIADLEKTIVHQAFKLYQWERSRS